MTDEPVADATDDLDAPVELADRPRQATAYERKLRAEAAAYRLAAKQAKAEGEANLSKMMAEAEAKLLAQDSEYRQRLMRAEMKAHAVKAGLNDVDTLKLFDLSKAELNEDGEITNAEALIETWRASKPHFFGAASTSSTAASPKAAPAQPTTARDMSDAELHAFERLHGIRR